MGACLYESASLCMRRRMHKYTRLQIRLFKDCAGTCVRANTALLHIKRCPLGTSLTLLGSVEQAVYVFAFKHGPLHWANPAETSRLSAHPRQGFSAPTYASRWHSRSFSTLPLRRSSDRPTAQFYILSACDSSRAVQYSGWDHPLCQMQSAKCTRLNCRFQ